MFTTGALDGVLRQGGKCFFDRVTLLFHQCNNTNITYQQFILVYVDILHIVNIVMLRCIFPAP